MALNCPDWAMVEGPLNELNSPVSRRGAALNERRPDTSGQMKRNTSETNMAGLPVFGPVAMPR
jgi:hypothetical protein